MDWPQGRARLLFALPFFLLPFSFFAACASVPSYPDPTPGEGQILVELKGVPREGVKGPARETVSSDYASHTESVEKGKAFERVKYDELRDVLVVLEHAHHKIIAHHDTHPIVPPLFLGPEGFAYAQHGADPLVLSTVEVQNTRDNDVELMAEGQDGSFKAVKIAAGKTVDLELDPGVYELTCDMDERAHCRVVVTETGFVWRGASDDRPFWDRLEPGPYELAIYAPRLPVVRKQVVVEGGKCTTVVAELTVNHLPRAR